MNNIIFLIFRRMRAPLIVLVVVYAVAVLGLVLTPGRDANGDPWHMDFFHAVYFISYTSTTIGFGELPHTFTGAQRLWVMVSIYLTVIAWIYSIGTLIALLQDPTFKQALVERRFTYRVSRMRYGFYLVCGYGETGSLLVRALAERHLHAVVIDIDPERINLLHLENLREYVPGLCADASIPHHLVEAGLKHKRCLGVVALTNVNEVNLQIAITTKLLHPKLKVICRADSHDVEANMASFGTDLIIDPFDTFALHLATALQTPGVYLLQQWVTGIEHQLLPDPIYPPRGRWVVCGYGRFGKAVHARLDEMGLETVVVEATPEITGTPEKGCVEGRGTEAVTLEEAGIRQAAGLVAGTDNDANNLSIIMTARQLNPRLFVVLRQNLEHNQEIVDAVGADVLMHPSTIIANRIRVLLTVPLLYEFVGKATEQADDWACQLVSRIVALTDEEAPEVWEVRIDKEQAAAVTKAINSGDMMRIMDILRDPLARNRQLPAIALLLKRDYRSVMQPDEETVLRTGDRLLLCGRYSARPRIEWTLQNERTLGYVRTGSTAPEGAVWRFLRKWARTGNDETTAGG
jgi:Trk K+ transport system NAD-binding subunit